MIRGSVGAESGEESVLFIAPFIAPSATSGRSRGTFLSSWSSFGTNKIQISTVAFLARSWYVLGRFVVKSC